MKRISFLLAAMAIILAGCNKDENENEVSQGAVSVPFVKGQKVTLTATADASGNASDTKTRVSGAVSGSTLSFTWSAGDALTVTVGGASTTFTMKSGAGTAEATFEGTMPADGTTFDASFGPSSVPTAQTYNGANTLPANAMSFKATGCTVGNSLTLLPQSSVLNLNLYGGSTTKKIAVKQDGGNTYTLNCGDGVTLGATKSAATPFYIVVPVGSYKFTVEIYDNATTPALITSFTTSSAQSFTTDNFIILPEKEAKVHEYVDLGLSVKWATCNVGASKPEEYGDYFAWGETTGYNGGKTTFNWGTYKWCNGTYKTMTKYCTQSSYGNEGFTDDKTVLEAADDAATANWGAGWRMPTYDECKELIDNCTWTWTQVSGVNGYLVTSTKSGYTDKSFFLPAAGFRGGAYLSSAGSHGSYWSSSLYTDYSYVARVVGFYSDSHRMSSTHRYYGKGVRPVRTE